MDTSNEALLAIKDRVRAPEKWVMARMPKNYPGAPKQQAENTMLRGLGLTAFGSPCSVSPWRWISGHLLPPGAFGAPNQRAKAPDVALRASWPGGLFPSRPNQNEVAHVVRFQAEMCCRICMCRPLQGWTEHSTCARQEPES